MGLKVDGDYIKDGSRKVARIKNDCIYKGTSTSSSNLLAYIRNDKFYSKKTSSSSYCIGMIKMAIFIMMTAHHHAIELENLEMQKEQLMEDVLMRF